jgi:sterol desaturase/sphingolipid hydroxylase (fatty acid hydroxylase superfamily)
MKKKHLLHHHLDDHAWYGVSNPVLDVLLGTNVPNADHKPGKSQASDNTHQA